MSQQQAVAATVIQTTQGNQNQRKGRDIIVIIQGIVSTLVVFFALLSYGKSGALTVAGNNASEQVTECIKAVGLDRLDFPQCAYDLGDNDAGEYFGIRYEFDGEEDDYTEGFDKLLDLMWRNAGIEDFKKYTSWYTLCLIFAAVPNLLACFLYNQFGNRFFKLYQVSELLLAIATAFSMFMHNSTATTTEILHMHCENWVNRYHEVQGMSGDDDCISECAEVTFQMEDVFCSKFEGRARSARFNGWLGSLLIMISLFISCFAVHVRTRRKRRGGNVTVIVQQAPQPVQFAQAVPVQAHQNPNQIQMVQQGTVVAVPPNGKAGFEL